MKNNYKIIEGIDQGSKKWHDLRCGSIGATGISKIITSSGDRSKSREKYLWQVAGEIIEGKSLEAWGGNAWTKRGNGLEDEARAMFCFENNVELKEVTMIKHNNLHWHCSPDAVSIDEDFGFETKCFSLEEFNKCKKKGILPTKNKLQVQASLALTDWEYWYYYLYFPNLKPMVLKINRDEKLIKIIKAEVRLFCKDVDKLIKEMKI